LVHLRELFGREFRQTRIRYICLDCCHGKPPYRVLIRVDVVTLLLRAYFLIMPRWLHQEQTERWFSIRDHNSPNTNHFQPQLLLNRQSPSYYPYSEACPPEGPYGMSADCFLFNMPGTERPVIRDTL
ncbi:MAG TPA: hypothetical protein PLK94_03815, partial [Alphaproteobacteria bacterium]|nr:hypothetical protein [Alphaproteobacteria bacterium]